jgi:hypothetical protein
MKKFTKPLIVIATLVGLGVIGSVMDRSSGAIALRAEGGPSVTIGSPLPLPVTATVTQPIQVTQVIGPGQLPGNNNLLLYVVPVKKRLVVEHFSSEVTAPSTATVNRYVLSVADPNNPGSVSFAHFIAPVFSAPCGTCVSGQVETIASQPIRMYVEAGKALVVNITFSAAVDAHTGGIFSASGYLVDAL